MYKQTSRQRYINKPQELMAVLFFLDQWRGCERRPTRDSWSISTEKSRKNLTSCREGSRKILQDIYQIQKRKLSYNVYNIPAPTFRLLGFQFPSRAVNDRKRREPRLYSKETETSSKLTEECFTSLYVFLPYFNLTCSSINACSLFESIIHIFIHVQCITFICTSFSIPSGI